MAHPTPGSRRRSRSSGPSGTRRRPRVDRAATASNWRQILAVDLLLGGVVLVGGLAVAVLLSAGPGIVVASVGAVYLVLGVRRWRRWARLRADSGLDPPGYGR